MKATRIYNTLAILGLLALSSCSLVGSIDNIKPKYVLTDDNVITDQATAEYNLNSVYTAFRAQHIFWFRHYLNILTGTETQGNLVGVEGFASNNVLETNSGVADNYTELYTVVNEATSFIANINKEGVQGISEARKKQMVGEASFLRALAYFYLLREYGEFYDLNSAYGIVLHGDTPIRTSQPMERATVQDSYTAIVADLDNAIANAPQQSLHYRVSQTTAKALKARVLLYMQQYPEAASLAKTVIQEAPMAGYMLGENLQKMFADGINMSEALFVLFTNIPNERDVDNNWTQPVGQKLQAKASSIRGDNTPDARFAAYFVNIAPETPWVSNAKYPNNPYAQDDPENTYFFLRLSEMYYIQAEAEARQGRFAAAKDALKQILCLPRAGYTEDYVNNIPESNLILTIVEQKWMELATESNEEWFDFVRCHVNDGTAIAPAYVADDTHLCMPIPRKAMAGNNLLKQNPAYTSN